METSKLDSVIFRHVVKVHNSKPRKKPTKKEREARLKEYNSIRSQRERQQEQLYATWRKNGTSFGHFNLDEL